MRIQHSCDNKWCVNPDHLDCQEPDLANTTSYYVGILKALTSEPVSKGRLHDERGALRQYIEARSIPIPFVGCWMWLLSCGNHGYGNVSQAISGMGKSGTAHRLSYEVFKGPIPDGRHVHLQHSCDNRWCVNPDHLSVGTAQTNVDDMYRKGRANREGRKFPPHPKRKLTAEDVIAIRASTESLNVLAHRYKIWKRAIHNIKKGVTYRDVIDPTGREA